MRYGILGTGVVGRGLGSRLVEVGHEVMLGSRRAGNPAAAAWASAVGPRASQGSFADAAAFGEVVVNATGGVHSLDALRSCGADDLRGKVLLDVANGMVPESGFPPRLEVCNGDSLAEQIQRSFPDARVVKSLNTMNVDVMVHPSLVPGSHNVFVCGNDASAKAVVVAMLGEFGWPASSVVDVGDITWARGLEMYLVLWLAVMRSLGTPHFNIAVQRG